MKKNEEVQKFFEGWELYKKVIANNYMLHTEIIEVLTQRLNRVSSKNLSILELGCGDSHTISKVMERITVSKYCGIDLSKIALGFAEKNLERKVSQRQFIVGDMVAEFNDISESYDVILAGYSLHHLEKDIKNKVLQNCKKRLNRNGKILIYDIVHETDEDCEQYLIRYVQHFEKNWIEMTDEQHIMTREHVLKYDIPESLLNWQELAQKNDFHECTCKFRDENKMYAIMEISV